jgi:hypothetical protein
MVSVATGEKMSQIELPAWTGELGWEVMTWVPWCRRQSRGHDRVIASSFAEMSPLYADFVTEFRPHCQAGRSLDYPKMYRVDGEFYKYGKPYPVNYDLLIHARGISRKIAINYRRWDEVIERLVPLRIGCIGGADDHLIDGCFDLRQIGLAELMDFIAGASLVAGVSSGVMHLAAACGADLVVWGDNRTYFGETLQRRYTHTWNPFSVAVEWLEADDWQPEPESIVQAIVRRIAAK